MKMLRSEKYGVVIRRQEVAIAHFGVSEDKSCTAPVGLSTLATNESSTFSMLAPADPCYGSTDDSDTMEWWVIPRGSSSNEMKTPPITYQVNVHFRVHIKGIDESIQW